MVQFNTYMQNLITEDENRLAAKRNLDELVRQIDICLSYDLPFAHLAREIEFLDAVLSRDREAKKILRDKSINNDDHQ